jgi:hypothetical protein
MALLGWYLQQIRRKNITGKKKEPIKLDNLLLFKQPQIRKI